MARAVVPYGYERHVYNGQIYYRHPTTGKSYKHSDVVAGHYFLTPIIKKRTVSQRIGGAIGGLMKRIFRARGSSELSEMVDRPVHRIGLDAIAGGKGSGTRAGGRFVKGGGGG